MSINLIPLTGENVTQESLNSIAGLNKEILKNFTELSELVDGFSAYFDEGSDYPYLYHIMSEDKSLEFGPISLSEDEILKQDDYVKHFLASTVNTLVSTISYMDKRLDAAMLGS